MRSDYLKFVKCAPYKKNTICDMFSAIDNLKNSEKSMRPNMEIRVARETNNIDQCLIIHK